MKLRQWVCVGPDERNYIFTPDGCDYDTALAIAQAFYGRRNALTVVDEGSFTQGLAGKDGPRS